MNLGLQDKKKRNIAIVAGILALVAGCYMYSELFGSDTPAPTAASVVVTTPAPTVVVPVRKTVSGNTVGSQTKASGILTDAQLDPTLHMEAMLVTESLVYSGNGRNIFSANSAPATTSNPRPIASVRTLQPIAPVRTGPVGPPPPPPIELKFFGTETNAAGSRRAFLLHGEDVFLVTSGDIVQRRYRIISVDAHSILVEDIANSNRQTLPLQSN
jgi:hypothetical protein